MLRALNLILFAGLMLIATAPTDAIVTRHDVDDARYIALARDYTSPIVVARGPQGGSNGMATWIGNDWLLTAAHVAGQFEVGSRIGETGSFEVAAIEYAPGWPGTPVDVALIRVAARGDGEGSVESPRPEDRPMGVCAPDTQGDDAFVFIGAGDTGDGNTGPTRVDAHMRAAQNRLTDAGRLFLTFTFDAPESDDAEPLEGISGPGDSGGPAYRIRGDAICIAGVSSGQDAEPTGGRAGRYGVVEYYARVDTLGEWIAATLAET